MTTKGEKIASRFGAGRLAPSWPVLDVAQTGTVGDGPLLLMEIVADVLISDGCHRAGVAATLNPTLPDETFANPLGYRLPNSSTMNPAASKSSAPSTGAVPRCSRPQPVVNLATQHLAG
jgi:hypothetical protein